MPKTVAEIYRDAAILQGVREHHGNYSTANLSQIAKHAQDVYDSKKSRYEFPSRPLCAAVIDTFAAAQCMTTPTDCAYIHSRLERQLEQCVLDAKWKFT